MTGKVPNYQYDVQKLYLEMFLSDSESFLRCQNIFDAENFDRRLAETAEFIKSYAYDYKCMPEVDIVNSVMNIDLKSVTYHEDQYKWLLTNFENFSRHKTLERAIIKSAEYLEKGDYGPVEKMIKDAVQIGLQTDMGTDYFSDPRTRIELMRSSNGQISTGWPTVDKRLFGGFNRGELEIFCAGSGGGKSLFLANLARNWAEMGLNVIYITCELSENLVSYRLDSIMTGIDTKSIFKKIDDVELTVKMLGKKMGEIQIKFIPAGKTCNDIRAYLKEFQIQTGLKPDVVLVDYLDLLMPATVKISASDLFVKDKYVSEDLRNLAMELNVLLVSCSQLNRSAVEEIEFDHSHISGGLSKIQTADNVIGIFTSRLMKERGRYQIQFMKTRNSSGVGQKVDLGFDTETLKITDIGESDENSAPGGSIYSALKKTATVTSEEDSPKPKNVQSTSKIRELLSRANLDNDI